MPFSTAVSIAICSGRMSQSWTTTFCAPKRAAVTPGKPRPPPISTTVFPDSSSGGGEIASHLERTMHPGHKEWPLWNDAKTSSFISEFVLKRLTKSAAVPGTCATGNVHVSFNEMLAHFCPCTLLISSKLFCGTLPVSNQASAPCPSNVSWPESPKSCCCSTRLYKRSSLLGCEPPCQSSSQSSNSRSSEPLLLSIPQRAMEPRWCMNCQGRFMESPQLFKCLRAGVQLETVNLQNPRGEMIQHTCEAAANINATHT
mmetsp:Transcript_19791/g.38767  ORF Transcript_19791/g.38767 Transcript_19791/m.38767 type:complete len:257 (+) Transcript_19791:549-1319(+)